MCVTNKRRAIEMIIDCGCRNIRDDSNIYDHNVINKNGADLVDIYDIEHKNKELLSSNSNLYASNACSNCAQYIKVLFNVDKELSYTTQQYNECVSLYNTAIGMSFMSGLPFIMGAKKVEPIVFR